MIMMAAMHLHAHVHLMAANKPSHFRRPFRIFISFSAAAAIIIGRALLSMKSDRAVPKETAVARPPAPANILPLGPSPSLTENYRPTRHCKLKWF